MSKSAMSLNEKHADFFHNVFAIVRLIPTGCVTSYGSIAKALGTPKSSRMVGWAMNASHQHKGVPAHRVVNRNGMLTGKMHFNPPESMQEQLENEGIQVKDDKIINFAAHFWDPQEEIGF